MMTLSPLERLRTLRQRREDVARLRFAADSAATRVAEAESAATAAQARRFNARLERRNRTAIAGLLGEPATPLTFARVGLEYRKGQEDLLTALRFATARARHTETLRASAAASGKVWTKRAVSARKLDLLIDKLVDREPSDGFEE
jgi:hypothetical protein